MGSRILYNKETLEIIRCQRKPFGSAGMPSFEAICMSALIPEDEKELMGTCIINERISTKEAIERLRIVNGEIIHKPKLEITVDKQQVDISIESVFSITIDITETIESDNFSIVSMLINDVNFDIIVNNNTGTQSIELSDAGLYVITCSDNRFRSQPIQLEVV